MFTQTLEQSPKNPRGGGQTSHLLLAPAQFGSRNLAITWVHGATGSRQPLHAHPDSEQVYVIVAGRGRMILEDEEQDVGAGTMVLIPPGAQHAIHNPGPEQLVYVTATSPPFPMPTGEFAYHPADDSSPNTA
jgi:mannose-6-phosphate isomerase-like protein (cupin superfamily)